MAKYALLVGVSIYEHGFNALPGAQNDIQRVRKVLESNLCNFEPVTALLNPERQTLEEKIYELFADKTPDDVILFYFSGHGVTDQDGNLFLTTPQARKNNEGLIVEPTTVRDSYLQTQMNSSRSQYQVIVLDCCFSGAFMRGYVSKGLNDNEIDVSTNLGGKGRAILTSSSSLERSFQDKEAGLSIYTRYFVEGIETGDADLDKNGRISVDELHTYISQRFQESHLETNPRLYPVEQGYAIFIAKSPRKTTVKPLSGAKMGLILVGNVINFSDMRGVDQREIIQMLWQFIMEHHILAQEYFPEIDGALDRFIIAWPGVDHQEVINFACSLTEYMQSQNPSTELRIGLHQGWFESIERVESKGTHLIGVGPNECVRIARIADVNNIILSDEFAKSWAQLQGRDIYTFLVPNDPESPIEVFPKPYVSQKIFIYKRNRNFQQMGNVPRVLRILDVANRKLLDEVLPDIDDVFIELLQDCKADLDWQNVCPRISLLAPDYHDKNVLRSTKFRYLKYPDPDDRNNLKLKLSHTKYRLEGQGQGPPGRCFKSTPPSPVVVHGLPNYNVCPEAYIENLEEFDLPRKTIEGFSRHARAFINFPFMLSDDGPPGGIVCIDTLSSLEEVSDSDLIDIAYVLMDFYGSFIAALWEIRVGIGI